MIKDDLLKVLGIIVLSAVAGYIFLPSLVFNLPFILIPAAKEKSQMPTARQSAKSMFSIGRITLPGAIARVLMETRSHAALPPMTPRLRFQVWVKEITPPSSSITSFPISRRAISPTDGLNAPVSEAAPDLSPRNSAPAPLCLSQGYKARTSIAR